MKERWGAECIQGCKVGVHGVRAGVVEEGTYSIEDIDGFGSSPDAEFLAWVEESFKEV
jgi:hypothetical protein